MTSRWLYIKLISFIYVIVGFSFSMTSFYNFYNYVFGNIEISNGNIVIMSFGLVIPLYIFIFGIYFYLLGDKIQKISKNTSIYLVLSFIILLMIGILIIVFKSELVYENLFSITQIFEFIHCSLGYVLVILNVMAIVGYFKYLYRRD